MKKIITFLSVLFLFAGTAFATRHTITTVNMTFSPDITLANVGDTIEFVVGDYHTATQVSMTDWYADIPNPLSGGFDFGSGTYEYVVKGSDAEGIYYVCVPHITMGMKGMISVHTVSAGIESLAGSAVDLKVSPSLTTEDQTLSVELPGASSLKVKVYSLSGVEVKRAEASGSQLSLPATFGKGVYLLQATGADGRTYVKKVVVK